MKPPAPSFLRHPNGCVIEFQPLPDDMVRFTSRRAGRADWGFTIGHYLARSYWKGWVAVGFQPETKGN